MPVGRLWPEADLTDGRDLYQELFEGSPDAILIIEGDRFIDCNPAAVRMLRYPSKQALLERYSGQSRQGGLRAHPGEFSPPFQPDGRDSFEKAEEMMGLAFERGSHLFEWDHLRADGEVFPVEVQLTVVRRGERPTLHVVWREIAERRRLEAELRQAQRLEAVGRMAGGIAHDFNNLLVVIFSHAELLEEEAGPTSAAAEHARAIRASGERAAALTEQLLTFSRGQPVQPRPIDLVRLVEELCSLLRRLIGEDIELDLELGQVPLTVVADPSQVEQLVINLAANARDAMPDGGRLEIRVTPRPSVQQSGGSGHSPSAEVELCVRDSGIGMRPDQAERAFDPFYTTKPIGKGAGLGLATVHAVANQCGGSVRIESVAGQGTAVRVFFPLSDLEPENLEAISHSAGSLQGKETILLVEDEPEIRAILAEVIQSYGYRVLVASDGVQALTLIDESDHAIDLLLTDVVMPKLSGPELARRVAGADPQVRVVYMSGYSQEGALRPVRSGEDVRILKKPFSPRVLLSALRQELDSQQK